MGWLGWMGWDGIEWGRTNDLTIRYSYDMTRKDREGVWLGGVWFALSWIVFSGG